MPELIDVFPCPVGIFQERVPTADELNFIKSLDQGPNLANRRSLNTQVLDAEELTDLRSIIQDRVDMYFDTVYNTRASHLRLTQSWCNYSDAGEGHHQHSHPNSAISGVYYPQAEAIDRLTMHTPLRPHQHMQVTPEVYNKYNSQELDIEVKSGTLVLFYSYLEHSVGIVDDRKDTRISLSFNTFWVGNLGNKQELTGLTL